MTTEARYDVVIIGGGPGGYVAAIRAAQLGLRTALVEREHVGGVCLNKGCIPTKAMLRSAEVFRLAQKSQEFGVQVENVRLDYPAVVGYRDRVVRGLRNGVAGLLKSNGVDVLQGTGRLAGPGQVEVEANGQSRRLQAGNVILATGSTPAELPIPGASGPRVINSDQALELPEVPRSVLVIGGGAVGAEWATIFREYGAQVTVVEMLPTLLPLEDADIGRGLERLFTARGIAVKTQARVERVEPRGDGQLACTVTTKDGRQEQVAAEYVLVGVGRRPNTGGLGLEASGLRTTRGWVEVDDHLRTNVPTVYAIGDLTGRALLAHVASHQGLVAVENIAGHDRAMDYKAVPAVTFTHPEVASVGLTEAKAREAGHEVVVGRFPFAASGRAMTYGETDGFVKVVAESKYGEVLGVHILGQNASELLPEAVLGLRLEATLEDLAETIHAHPTFPEAVMEAALVALGRPIHVAKPRARAAT
ncbi:MAG: dihydrolipoyl dehydrogenase [Chloroflexi bacterium]|nr:dihydrolipoyl dehydrogenase [Chloroflexota bacterium]